MSTVAAISTPVAAGGIGMIRISGERALEVAARCFRPVGGKAVRDMRGYTAAYGAVLDGDAELDDGVLIVYRAPKSYTGEDVAEICCHGGVYILRRALNAVLRQGAEPAGPGEFTKRAFLNGKMDLSQAESVMRVISAQGECALSAARGALRGGVSKKIEAVCEKLVSAAASLAVWADYPDEDVPAVENDSLQAALEEVRDALARLIRDYENGRAVSEGVNAVICGRPNVGKSTLMNLLSGYDRSIVTPVAGTTRDVVEETVRVGDLLLRLSDTAGLRETDDPVERIGVRAARDRLRDAALLLLVFDRAVPFTEEDAALLDACPEKLRVAVINKTDLPPAWDASLVTDRVPAAVEISAKDPASAAALEEVLTRTLGVSGMDFSQELLVSARQKACCEAALRDVEDALSALAAGVTADAVSVDVDCALDALLTLTGKRASEEVVNEVFRSFCVGK